MDMHDFKMAAELLRFSLDKADRTWIDSAHIYDYEPYDMLCQAYWWGGDKKKAIAAAAKALSCDPENERLKSNLEICLRLTEDEDYLK